jgi:hypothetical protein
VILCSRRLVGFKWALRHFGLEHLLRGDWEKVLTVYGAGRVCGAGRVSRSDCSLNRRNEGDRLFTLPPCLFYAQEVRKVDAFVSRIQRMIERRQQRVKGEL